MAELPDRMAGANVPQLSITWQDEDGNDRRINGTITGFMTNLETATTTAIGGTLTAAADQTTNTGEFTYAPNSTDVATAGRFSVYFLDTDGSNIAKSLPVGWNIINAPST